MIGVPALACFVAGFIAAWVLPTGFVMTQVSWAQERMERKVRYRQGEAVYARSVAEPALQHGREVHAALAMFRRIKPNHPPDDACPAPQRSQRPLQQQK
jgi:hypothetical protein